MNTLNSVHVIILVGGTRSDLRNIQLPKAMLPVCNEPVVSYQLESILKQGFERVSIICKKSDKEDIQNWLTEYIQKISDKSQVDVRAKEDYSSTVEAISKVRDKDKEYYFVVSGDVLIIPDFLYTMIDSHKLENASLSIALQEVKNEKFDPKKDHPIDIVGLADNEKLLTFKVNTKDIDKGNNIKIRTALFKKFPNLVFKKVIDSRFYLISKNTFAILDRLIESVKKDGGTLSLRKDVIPYLLKTQYIKSKKSDIAPLKCIACMVSPKLYMKRVNNVRAYFEVNKDVSSGQGPKGHCFSVPSTKDFMPSKSKNEKYETSIQPGCIIGVGTEIENKCKIIGSILGNHVRVGANTRIINSIIMNHVTIEEGCELKNTIVCNDVLVNSKSTHHDTILTKGE